MERPKAPTRRTRRERPTDHGFRHDLDHVGETIERYDRDGCGFGRVTRERLDGVERLVIRLETKLNALLLGVSIQLLAFVFAVVLFVLYRKP